MTDILKVKQNMMGEGLELVRPNIDKIYEPRIGVEAKTLAMEDKGKIRLCAVCGLPVKLDSDDYYFQDWCFDEHEDHKKNSTPTSYWVHEYCVGKPINQNFDRAIDQRISSKEMTDKFYEDNPRVKEWEDRHKEESK